MCVYVCICVFVRIWVCVCVCCRLHVHTRFARVYMRIADFVLMIVLFGLFPLLVRSSWLFSCCFDADDAVVPFRKPDSTSANIEMFNIYPNPDKDEVINEIHETTPLIPEDVPAFRGASYGTADVQQGEPTDDDDDYVDMRESLDEALDEEWIDAGDVNDNDS